MRSVRLLLVSLTITLILLVLAAANARGVMAGPAPVPVDSLPYVTSVRIGPPPVGIFQGAICPGEPIPVRVTGEFPNRCWAVRGIVLIPPPPSFAAAPPTVRLLFDDRACLTSVCVPFPRGFSIDTVLAGLPPMGYGLPVQVALVSCSDSIAAGHLYEKRYPFAVAASCSSSVPSIVQLSTVPAQPCDHDVVGVRARLTMCPPCAQSLGMWMDATAGLFVRYQITDSVVCVARPGCVGDSAFVTLGMMGAGHYSLSTLTRTVIVHPSGAIDSVDTRGTFTFDVGSGCGPYVPPIPLDSRVRIAGQAASDSTSPVACLDLSIPVHVEGSFGTTCGHVAKVELIPSPLTVIGPPTLRILLDSDYCRQLVCGMYPKPWSVDTVLPVLPRGAYRLNVEVAQVSCSDTILPGRIVVHAYPFSVAQPCSANTANCFFTSWGPAQPGSVCNAVLVPGGNAGVELSLRSSVALAGLQGLLRVDPSLAVRELAPIGPAAGMTLQWRPTADGARFVMYATSGAPIPGAPFTDSLSRPLPVLRVTVGNAPGQPAVPVAFVRSDSLLGADVAAHGVPECPDYRMTPVAPGARVCLGTTCDVNGDGVADVRDLVLMVHCILGNGPCADTTAGRHDCNGDGRANLDDVLCCAHTILRGGVRDSVPGRSEPAVALQFGEAQRTANGVTLPLTLEGADRVGAARLALTFPADRYELDGLTGAGSDWLALSEVQGDQVVVGLIAVGTPAPGASVPLTLGLRLKAGAEHGGEVAVASADVSAPDGASLATGLVGAGASIGGATVLSLGVQPNPFDAGGTTLRFTLPHAAQIELAVYDVAGRRVATVVSGAMAAGSYTRRWDASGAHSGVYFVRLRADGVELAHKAVLRRGN